MKIKTMTDYPLCIGKMIERSRHRNALWIRRQHIKEKWKSLWLSVGIILASIVIYWLWQPLAIKPDPQGPVDPCHSDNPLNDFVNPTNPLSPLSPVHLINNRP